MTEKNYNRIKAIASVFTWSELDELSCHLNTLDNLQIAGAGNLMELINDVMFVYDELREGLPI